MARLITSGAESGHNAATIVGPDGGYPVANVAIETTVVRSGSRSWKCDTSTVPNYTYFVARPAATWVSDTQYFFRAYFRVSSLPAGNAVIMGSAASFFALLTSGGKIKLVRNDFTQIGSDSAATVAVDQWYRLEMATTYHTSPAVNYDIELRLDGVTVASATATSNATGSPGNADHYVGWPLFGTTNPGTNRVIYVDDVAINDASGSDQNSWPGEGKVVLLLPTSDNTAGSWKKGSAANAADFGGTGYDAVNNTPPVGTTSPNATTAAISNAVSGATTPDADFNMTTYAAAGVPSGATVKAVQMVIVHGEDISTGIKTGTFKIVSNPDSGTADTIKGTSSSQFGPDSGGAVNTYGTFPVRWIAQWGPAVHSPSVVLGTAPVARITKTDTGTYAADCCFMGIYVDYTEPPPSAGGARVLDSQRASLGVMSVSGG